jgi:hypothetical protein
MHVDVVLDNLYLVVGLQRQARGCPALQLWRSKVETYGGVELFQVPVMQEWYSCAFHVTETDYEEVARCMAFRKF